MRLRAYEEKTKGNIAPYETFWQTQLSQVKSMFHMLKQPTQQIKSQMIERVRAIQTQAVQALANPQATANAKNVSRVFALEAVRATALIIKNK